MCVQLEWKHMFYSPPLVLTGVCRFSGHPFLGDECQERHQCRTVLHDHGSWDKEAHGAGGHSQRGQAQPKDREHPCQAVWRRLLLKDPPLPITSIISTESALYNLLCSFSTFHPSVFNDPPLPRYSFGPCSTEPFSSSQGVREGWTGTSRMWGHWCQPVMF